MRILVTGAAGYVGNNLVRRLVQGGHTVRALVRHRAKVEARLADLTDRLEIAEGDVTEPATLAPAFEGVDAVIHLVAVAIEKGAATYERINTQGTIHVVNAATAAGVPRFVNMSQNGARADSPYRFLASKGKAQDYVAASGLRWTGLLPSVIWGPQDEFANVQARLIKLTPLVFPLVGDGQAKFQPVWVGDVVEAAARCVDDETTVGQKLWLAGPEVLTYEEIVRRVLAALGARRRMVRVPVAALRPLVKLMEVALPNPPVTTSLLEMLDEENTVPRNDLIERFHIAPRPFLPEYLGYMRAFTTTGTLRRLFGNRTADEPQAGRTA